MTARRSRALQALAAAALYAALPAAGAPASVNATYEVKVNGGPVGTLSEHYAARDGAYRITSTSQPTGVFALVPRLAFRLVSEGAVSREGLRPRRFEGRRARGDAVEAGAEFDWEARELTVRHDGRVETLALPRGAQDRLSVMYEFMHRLPRLAAASELEVHVTNGRRLDHYRYSVRRDVELDTPLGRLKTVHLVRLREADDNGHEVWLASEQDYVPVRMLIVERDGPRFEQIITQLDRAP